jgi:hypothetical protein
MNLVLRGYLFLTCVYYILFVYWAIGGIDLTLMRVILIIEIALFLYIIHKLLTGRINLFAKILTCVVSVVNILLMCYEIGVLFLNRPGPLI